MRSTFSSAGLPLTMECTIRCTGSLIGDNQADMDAKLALLYAAVTVPYQDLLFFLDSGQLSSLRLRNKDSLSGVKLIAGPLLPIAPPGSTTTTPNGGRYSNNLPFDMTFSASYAHPSLTVTGQAGSGGGVIAYPLGGVAHGGGPGAAAFTGGGGTSGGSAPPKGVTGGSTSGIPGLGSGTGTGGGPPPKKGAGGGKAAGTGSPSAPVIGSPFRGLGGGTNRFAGGGGAGKTSAGLYQTGLIAPTTQLISGDLTSSLPGGLRPGVIPAGYLTAFHEAVSISGGEALYGLLESMNARPQKQLLKAHTTCMATQSGSATGYADYPPIPPPLWPEHLKMAPKYDLKEPTREGMVYHDFTVSWTYTYEAPYRLSGTPHWWPG